MLHTTHCFRRVSSSFLVTPHLLESYFLNQIISATVYPSTLLHHVALALYVASRSKAGRIPLARPAPSSVSKRALSEASGMVSRAIAREERTSDLQRAHLAGMCECPSRDRAARRRALSRPEESEEDTRGAFMSQE